MERADELSLQFNTMNLEGAPDGASAEQDSQAAEFSQAGDGAQSSNCNLIVNYLPHDVDDNGVRGIFQEFGEIIMTKVVRDKNTKKSLGYGFVKFAKDADAARALEKMNGATVGHKVLKVSIARPPSLEIRNCKLYVTNLPKEFGEREVINLFQEFGEIIECRVLRDKNSKFSKGVAFVQFNLKSQATRALSLNGMQLEGATRGLVVKFAEDQHKKKELNRLHNLTMNAAFRGPNGGQGRGQGEDGHGNNGYFYPPAQSAAMGNLYGRQPNAGAGGNMGGGLYMPPSQNGVPSPVLDYSGGNKGGRKSLQLDIPNFQQQQMQSQPAGHWYPPVSSPHLGYVPSPSNLVHMGVTPSSNFEFTTGDFSPAGHNLHSMHHMGQLGSHLPPPAGSPQVSHGLTPFGRVNNHQSQLNAGGNKAAGGPQGAHQQGQPQQQQGMAVTISNLPRDTPARNLQSLLSQYAQVLDVQMEEQFYDVPGGGRGASTGMSRARVVVGGLGAAEDLVRSLNGAVLFEGGMPAQVNFA